jgi:hypothetical protein
MKKMESESKGKKKKDKREDDNGFPSLKKKFIDVDRSTPLNLISLPVSSVCGAF